MDLSDDNANIENLMNKSKNDIAYTILDLDKKASAQTIEKIQSIQGVIRVMTYQGDTL